MLMRLLVVRRARVIIGECLKLVILGIGCGSGQVNEINLLKFKNSVRNIINNLLTQIPFTQNKTEPNSSLKKETQTTTVLVSVILSITR